MDKFSKLLAERNVLLADGATGTNLFNMGLQAGDPPEFWNTTKPENITKLYEGAVNAGSDLFLTNSFGANGARLKLHNAQNRAYELSKVAAELGRNVADKADRCVLVAGSIGPTGEIMGEAGNLSHQDAVELFEETASGLIDGGADLLWIETISAPEEFIAASEAFANVGAIWAGTMSFDTAGRTMMGLTSEAMVKMVNALSYSPIAFGANCGVGASDLLRTVLGMQPHSTHPLIAKGNAGIPKYVDGHIHYDGTPELMAQYACLARDCGARIIGGCCGTMPTHLRAMREALDTSKQNTLPTLDVISSTLGAFSSDNDGTGDFVAPKRTRRRQRH